MKLLFKKIAGVITIIMVLFQFSVDAQDTLDLKRIEKAVDKYLTYFSNDNPGAVVTVIKNGDIIFNKSYGLSNIETGEKLTVNKSFNLAELSKSFTSLAVLKLVEKNKLSLEDNLRDVFNDFPEYGRNIKIKNLLNHTSGLASYDIKEVQSNDQLYEFLIKQKDIVFKPDSNRKYSNSDYTLLVKVIEKVSEMSYNDFMRKYIFNKLSMSNTFLAEDFNNKTNIADGHFKENEKYIVKNEVNQFYGEQGIYANSIDIAKWDKALYSEKLLKCQNLSKIFSVEKLLDGENVSNYNFGWALMGKDGIRYFWHGGSQSGYSNLILHLPDTHMTVLILTNRNDGYDFLKMSIYIAKLFDKDLKLLGVNN
ncbi:MAG: beta-lactamase family protein [Bacteroidales bacterium]|nr:beta-lactamase family protein [Bacteroidales bacterium]